MDPSFPRYIEQCLYDAELESAHLMLSLSCRLMRDLRFFVVAQFAEASPLLIGAGLLMGSLARMQKVDPGIDTSNLLSFAISLPAGAYPDSSSVHSFWGEALTRVKALRCPTSCSSIGKT